MKFGEKMSKRNFFFTERGFLSKKNNDNSKHKIEKNKDSLTQKLISQCELKTSRKKYS